MESYTIGVHHDLDKFAIVLYSYPYMHRKLTKMTVNLYLVAELRRNRAWKLNLPMEPLRSQSHLSTVVPLDLSTSVLMNLTSLLLQH